MVVGFPVGLAGFFTGEELRGKPWYRNHRWLSLAILLATIAAVVPFIR